MALEREVKIINTRFQKSDCFSNILEMLSSCPDIEFSELTNSIPVESFFTARAQNFSLSGMIECYSVIVAVNIDRKEAIDMADDLVGKGLNLALETSLSLDDICEDMSDVIGSTYQLNPEDKSVDFEEKSFFEVFGPAVQEHYYDSAKAYNEKYSPKIKLVGKTYSYDEGNKKLFSFLRLSESNNNERRPLPSKWQAELINRIFKAVKKGEPFVQIIALDVRFILAPEQSRANIFTNKRWNLQLNDFEDRFNDYFNGMADTLADIDVKNSIGKENLVFY